MAVNTITVIKSFDHSKPGRKIILAHLDEGVINVGDTFDNIDCTIVAMESQDVCTGFGAVISNNWAFLCAGKDIEAIKPEDKLTVTRQLDVTN